MDPSVLGIPWKRQLWHKWKSLRNVPFRKQWFVGYDLEGNSYWEMIDRNNPSRLRRKVSFERPYYFFGDFKPHPMWMQWLQYTRRESPTLEDLVNDMKRQHRLRVLAQQANEKWKSVPLKSAGAETSDPRINSAWTGQPGAAPAEEEDPTPRFEAPFETPANEKDRNVLEAMRHAEEQIRRAPKVRRDANGTTVPPRPRASQSNSSQPNVSQPNVSQPHSRGPDSNPATDSSDPFRAHASNSDEPQSASFKPKSRA